jgi:hypothetical protein
MVQIPSYTTPKACCVHGTPHVRGAKSAAGQVRKGLKQLAALLVASGWVSDHPVYSDEVSTGLIELVDQLGPAERHALRIAASMLVRIAEKNGYHHLTNGN